MCTSGRVSFFLRLKKSYKTLCLPTFSFLFNFTWLCSLDRGVLSGWAPWMSCKQKEGWDNVLRSEGASPHASLSYSLLSTYNPLLWTRKENENGIKDVVLLLLLHAPGGFLLSAAKFRVLGPYHFWHVYDVWLLLLLMCVIWVSFFFCFRNGCQGDLDHSPWISRRLGDWQAASPHEPSERSTLVPVRSRASWRARRVPEGQGDPTCLQFTLLSRPPDRDTVCQGDRHTALHW